MRQERRRNAAAAAVWGSLGLHSENDRCVPLGNVLFADKRANDSSEILLEYVARPMDKEEAKDHVTTDGRKLVAHPKTGQKSFLSVNSFVNDVDRGNVIKSAGI